VALLGADRAKAFATELRDEALAALATFGARAVRLNELTRYIVERSY
jgi:geranylgeranyl diphosphate synthase type II